MSESGVRIRTLSGVSAAGFADILGISRNDIGILCGALIDKCDFHYDIVSDSWLSCNQIPQGQELSCWILRCAQET